MRIKQCDICGNDFRTGIKIGVKRYEIYHVFKLWIPIPKYERMLICTRCEDTLRGVVRNYRKERISDF